MKKLAFLLVICGTAGLILFFEGSVLDKYHVMDHVSSTTFIGTSLGGLMLGFILLVARG